MKKLHKYKHLFMFLPFLSLAFPPFLHFQENITSQLGPVSIQVKVRMQDIKSMDKPSELLIPGSGILRYNGPWLVRRELYHLWEIIKWLIKSPGWKRVMKTLPDPAEQRQGCWCFHSHRAAPGATRIAAGSNDQLFFCTSCKGKCCLFREPRGQQQAVNGLLISELLKTYF